MSWDNLTKWKDNATYENKIDKDILQSVISRIYSSKHISNRIDGNLGVRHLSSHLIKLENERLYTPKPEENGVKIELW